MKKKIKVVITLELLERSGEFVDHFNCPLATFFKELFPDMRISAGLGNIFDASLPGNWRHLYTLDKAFGEKDHELVKNGEIFETIARTEPF